MLENIQNGKAYNKFVELVKNQNGDTSYIENTEKFPKAKYILKVESDEAGYVSSINARTVGEISCMLGAGRLTKDDEIDKSVGVVLAKKVSDKIEKGDVLAFVYANKEDLAMDAVQELKRTYKITKEEVEKPQVILDIVK